MFLVVEVYWSVVQGAGGVAASVGQCGVRGAQARDLEQLPAPLHPPAALYYCVRTTLYFTLQYRRLRSTGRRSVHCDYVLCAARGVLWQPTRWLYAA